MSDVESLTAGYIYFAALSLHNTEIEHAEWHHSDESSTSFPWIESWKDKKSLK